MIALLLAAALAPQAPAAELGPYAAPPCPVLSARLDDKDGAFDGMSHSGVQLILRNMGAMACSVPGLPMVSFIGANGRPLPIRRASPPGMHPGPVVTPVILPPGGVASTALRWVSSDVFDNGRCLTPARIVVQPVRRPLALAFGRQICGPVAAITFEQPVLAPGAGQP